LVGPQPALRGTQCAPLSRRTGALLPTRNRHVIVSFGLQHRELFTNHRCLSNFLFLLRPQWMYTASRWTTIPQSKTSKCVKLTGLTAAAFISVFFRPFLRSPLPYPIHNFLFFTMAPCYATARWHPSASSPQTCWLCAALHLHSSAPKLVPRHLVPLPLKPPSLLPLWRTCFKKFKVLPKPLNKNRLVPFIRCVLVDVQS
jgi:hypothetical protein